MAAARAFWRWQPRRWCAAEVVGVDIDPQAVETIRLNTAANGLTASYAVSDAEINRQFDMVVANILAGPLTVLAPAICAHVKAGWATCARRYPAAPESGSPTPTRRGSR